LRGRGSKKNILVFGASLLRVNDLCYLFSQELSHDLLISFYIDLGTTKDIQSTFVGGGFGTSFYNNLNFNVTYLLPIKYNGSTKFEHGAINLGFDIYFGEYISALNKKRKANKKAKLESQYANQNAQNKTAVKESTIIR